MQQPQPHLNPYANPSIPSAVALAQQQNYLIQQQMAAAAAASSSSRPRPPPQMAFPQNIPLQHLQNLPPAQLAQLQQFSAMQGISPQQMAAMMAMQRGPGVVQQQQPSPQASKSHKKKVVSPTFSSSCTP